ncbi:hypothetical protein ACIRRH_16240 [Kitasatospora sp. NPDC101235]|uniref:hypothetical protein n=1 Tax=Kitasatospora sp. NPDC101235 TaxID=3364101 RepID=UPI003829EB9F
MTEYRRVPACQWGWAVAAVVVAVIGAGLGIAVATYFGALFAITAMVAASPLALRESPKTFARVCLSVGTGLLVWALIGIIVGMFVFIPAALLLFVASFAARGNRPGAWFALAVPLAGAAAVVAFVALVVRG